MKYTYKEFLEDNKITKGTRASIVGVNFAEDRVKVMNQDRETFSVPIPILICDMLNNVIHINNASKLKNWKFWGKEVKYQYPDDYFENIYTKYVFQL